MTTKSEVARANLLEVVRAINDALRTAEFAGSEKERLAVSCLEIALEHQASILRLGTDGAHGSMFALLRPLAESYVRGTWLFRCADDKGVRSFKTATLKKLAELLTDIECSQGSSVKAPIKKVVDDLHDFTHTGINQVLRRTIAGGHYPDGDLAKAYNLASTFGLLAALELASLATDHAQRVPILATCVQGFLPRRA